MCLIMWQIKLVHNTKYVMQYIKREDFAEGKCVLFHYYDNGQFAICFDVVLVVSWNKSSKRLGFCLLKIGISLIVHNQNI